MVVLLLEHEGDDKYEEAIFKALKGSSKILKSYREDLSKPAHKALKRSKQEVIGA